MLEKTKGEKKNAIVKIGEKREKERRKKPVTREHLRPSKRLSLSNGGKKKRFLCKNFEFQKIACIREGYL